MAQETLIATFEKELHLYFAGVLDAIAVHRTLPLLVNHQDVLLTVLKIFGANGALILGSVALFHRGILPFLNTLNEKAFDLHDAVQYDSLLWFLYQALWLVPICVLCYLCCVAWYQELADLIHKKLSNAKDSDGKKPSQSLVSVTKSLEYVLYATLAWLFVYIQVQLLAALIPSVTHLCEDIVEYLIPHDPSHAALLRALHLVIKHSFSAVAKLLKWTSLTLGLSLMSLLYAWYAFDPKWIAHHVNPDERFAIIEKHVAYFLGFGTPSVLLIKSTSFFVGFGGFLMLFPFWIILGSVTDFATHYEAHDMKPTRRIRVFRLAQIWTLRALKFFGANIEKTKNLLEKQKQHRLERLAAAAAAKSEKLKTT